MGIEGNLLAVIGKFLLAALALESLLASGKALLDERMLICSTLLASLRPHCLKFMVEE